MKIRLFLVFFTIFIVVFVWIIFQFLSEIKEDLPQDNVAENPLLIEDPPSETLVEILQPEIEDGSVRTADDGTQHFTYRYHIAPIGSGTEYPAENQAVLLNRMKNYMTDGEISLAIQTVEELLPHYRFSEKLNLDIAGYYKDAKKVYSHLVEKHELESIYTKLARHHGFVMPDTLAIMPLYYPESYRRLMVDNPLTISPIYDGKWAILSEQVISWEDWDDQDHINEELRAVIGATYMGIQRIYIYEISSKSDVPHSLWAYVVESSAGDIHLYGYYPKESNSHTYQTHAYYETLDARIQAQTNDRLKETIEYRGEYGGVTIEDLEEYLYITD